MTREETIEVLKDWDGYFIGHSSDDVIEALNMAIKALEQEPLTDTEQRIFLAAMDREEKICKKVDKEYPCEEPFRYGDPLLSVCKSIKRKVKKALWE